MIHISIVNPTYNERENIAPLLKQWMSVVENRQEKLEIIVVDDNSPDGTADAARVFSAEFEYLRVIKSESRKGISAAWVCGCEQSRGEYIGIMDADLCHSPSDFMQLYDKCRSENIDMVIGSRYLESSQGMRGKSLAAILASHIAQIFIRMLFRIALSDATHSFRIFKKDLVNQIIPNIGSKGNSWLMEFSLMVVQLGYRVSEHPISYGTRTFGKTKLNLGKEGFRFLWRMVILKSKL